jgi:phage tail sheath protein FI
LRGLDDPPLEFPLSDRDLKALVDVSINPLRDLRAAGRGVRVWGGRTLSSDAEFRYLAVRRLLIFLETSIDRGLEWVVFEPNAEPLWHRVRDLVGNFLTTQWRAGLLQGQSTQQAYFVRCGMGTTMTQNDLDDGRLICEVGVAAVKPAEFVIFRIGRWTADREHTPS